MIYKLIYRRDDQEAGVFILAPRDIDALRMAEFSAEQLAIPDGVEKALGGRPKEIEIINAGFRPANYLPLTFDELQEKFKYVRREYQVGKVAVEGPEKPQNRSEP